MTPMEIARKSMKTLSKDSRYSDRDSNWVPPVKNVTAMPNFSVTCSTRLIDYWVNNSTISTAKIIMNYKGGELTQLWPILRYCPFICLKV
jgi:hypothetical protein